MQPRGTVVCANRVFHHVSRIRYVTSLALHLGDIHSDHPRRPSSFLSHRLSRRAIQRKQGPDPETAQDCSTRCDVLFLGYVHFTLRSRDVSGLRKCKDIVIMLHHLCTAHLDLYSLVSN
jgi:hypothetical protein